MNTIATHCENESWNFLTFYDRELRRAPIRESTRSNQRSTLKQLETYCPTLTFEALNRNFVIAFARHLDLQGYHPNTVAKHLRHLKRYINLAMERGEMQSSSHPFIGYRIKTLETFRQYLTMNEIVGLERLPLSARQGRLKQARDAFVFCCFTGLRYSDFVSLTPACFSLEGKQLWLTYRSVKTQTLVRLPLNLLFSGRAVTILNRYKENVADFFSLPHNSNLNKLLVKLGRLASIDKPISFHTARHTNAVQLLHSGVCLSAIQKLLGHRNIRTTQHYAQMLDVTLIRELEKVTW